MLANSERVSHITQYSQSEDINDSDQLRLQYTILRVVQQKIVFMT